jgi:DNA-binding PadR family transcriptional regulator
MLKRVLKEGWIVAHSSTKTNGQLSVRKTYTITATGQAALASTEELRRRINNWV